MLQPHQSTATQRVYAPKELNSNEYVTSENVVRDVDLAIRSIPAHGTHALTTGVSDPNAEATTLSTLANRKRKSDHFRSIVNLPTPQPWLASTLHALQEWEGYVLEVGATDFLARLVDLTAGSTHEEEEADIPLDEISPRDRDRMCPGSIFRWVIGYETSAAGTRKRVSQIVLRDPPVMTRADLQDGEAWARKMIRSLRL